VPISKGILKKENVYGELSEVVLGKKIGRVSDEDVTVFDSTGLSLLDVSTALVVYKKAKKNGIGTVVKLH
jgi:ornithine cyclodeaminase/alanine dehydrogenase-like protein (mu-crystallin family)